MRVAVSLLVATVAIVASPSPTRVEAAPIFDNLAARGGPATITGSVGPVGFLAFGVELAFDRDVRISGFELYNAVAPDAIAPTATLRFVIFDAPGTNPLYYGPTATFAADLAGPTWKSSGALDFTFLAGRTYALGAISSVGMQVPLAEGAPPLTVDGITATGRMPNIPGNVSGTANPRYLGPAEGAQGFVRLYDDGPPPVQPSAVVPEPSSLALCGLSSLAGLVAWSHRREGDA
jgi:hypothetical protein